MIGAPILLGLVVAPSIRGGLIAAGALLLFLSRQPLKIAAQDVIRKKRYPRTAWAGGFALSEIGVAVVFIGISYAEAGSRLLVPLVVLAALSLGQFALETFGNGRAILPELVGSAAASIFATLIALASGYEMYQAWLLAGALTVHAWLAVVYVTRRLNHHQSTLAVVCSAATSVALATVVWVGGQMQWPIMTASAVLALRALWGVSRWQTQRRPQLVGVQEVAYTVFVVVAIALSIE